MSANITTIAVDVMGGDLGHSAAVAGCVSALDANPDISLSLVGDESLIKACLADQLPDGDPRLSIIHAEEFIAMDESPTSAVRNRKNSSMRLAIDLVKNKQAQACVSSGNTGALVALSKFVLKTVEGIKRPAILTPIPSFNGITVMLDLGANAVCDEQNLIDFAVMGRVVAEYDYQIKQPRVGLLNIGTESGKGHKVLNLADDLLRQTELNYIGFVEGNDIFSDKVDVVVSDGFTGNIALKTMEGFAQYFLTKLSSVFDTESAQDSANQSKSLLDLRTHNGASLVGLNGIVIKSHGDSDATALRYAIETAAQEANSHLPEKIVDTVKHFNRSYRSNNV